VAEGTLPPVEERLDVEEEPDVVVLARVVSPAVVLDSVVVSVGVVVASVVVLGASGVVVGAGSDAVAGSAGPVTPLVVPGVATVSGRT
jgi:hypothetical protein